MRSWRRVKEQQAEWKYDGATRQAGVELSQDMLAQILPIVNSQMRVLVLYLIPDLD